MQTQLSVRIPQKLEKETSVLAKKLHLRRSDIVRMALQRFLDETGFDNTVKPYDRVKHLLGAFSSGIPDLGESHRKHLLKKLKKHG